MRVFVTGAAGHIGSAVVTELIQGGHNVVGLARSDASAATVEALGADVHRGDLRQPAGLVDAARAADAIVHLAFDHTSVMAGDFQGAVTTDLGVIKVFGEALAGTGKTLVGIGVRPTGDPVVNANPRSAVTREINKLTERGVRTILVAVPPVTHSDQDRHGFVPQLIKIARDTGVSGYAGDGDNRWPAGHTLDVARLYRLALEKAPAGAFLVAAAEAGVPVREIAEAIGQGLGVPAQSVPAEHFASRFAFIAMNMTMDNAETRRLLGWEPTGPALLEDLQQGHYFDSRSMCG
ncbi:SDR family oxidoreductase [Frankia sp. R82]|uniref:SDR family oxidoreductase n=1 Tax=Frankia sp. R82 TaxID=2950553 RepID=UPI002043CC42|nr:SDR family oxidoreductase [Frankia sp. R82]MCM3886582.1 SDR family oxidoreductase [Frankia sp. R82]